MEFQDSDKKNLSSLTAKLLGCGAPKPVAFVARESLSERVAHQRLVDLVPARCKKREVYVMPIQSPTRECDRAGSSRPPSREPRRARETVTRCRYSQLRREENGYSNSCHGETESKIKP